MPALEAPGPAKKPCPLTLPDAVLNFVPLIERSPVKLLADPSMFIFNAYDPLSAPKSTASVEPVTAAEAIAEFGDAA